MQLPARDRLIVALDTSSYNDALTLSQQLGPRVGMLKLGFEFYSALGPDVVNGVACRHRVFLDLKLHDDPPVIAAALRNCAGKNVSFVSVHASAGRTALEAAAAARGTRALLAVTWLPRLTFLDMVELGFARFYTSEANGEPHCTEAHRTRAETIHIKNVVTRMAVLAHACGLQGVICASQEIAGLRAILPPDFLIVTPSIRPTWVGPIDREQTMTPREAIRAGADYIVMGHRSFTNPPAYVGTMLDALELIVADIETGFGERRSFEGDEQETQ